MVENRNDQQFRSESQMDREELYNEDDPNTLVSNDQSRGSQSYAQQGSQRRDEYANPDDFDELEDDELEDDEMISRVDVEDDMDILDDDDNPQMNQPNMPDSGFNPDNARNR